MNRVTGISPDAVRGVHQRYFGDGNPRKTVRRLRSGRPRCSARGLRARGVLGDSSVWVFARPILLVSEVESPDRVVVDAFVVLGRVVVGTLLFHDSVAPSWCWSFLVFLWPDLRSLGSERHHILRNITQWCTCAQQSVGEPSGAARRSRRRSRSTWTSLLGCGQARMLLMAVLPGRLS